jgi:hypothetical protein
MDIEEKALMRKEIGIVLNRFVGEENNLETRRKIGYEIKNLLEKFEIEFETLNLYTSPEDEKEGITDIRIDNELFPFDATNMPGASNLLLCKDCIRDMSNTKMNDGCIHGGFASPYEQKIFAAKCPEGSCRHDVENINWNVVGNNEVHVKFTMPIKARKNWWEFWKKEKN